MLWSGAKLHQGVQFNQYDISVLHLKQAWQDSSSPNPCIERNPDYIPPHNVSATCVCSDTYAGLDCSTTIADQIILSNEALRSSNSQSGCFSFNMQVLVPNMGNKVRSKQISLLQGCKLP